MQAQTFPTIDAYIAQFSPEIQKLLQKVRETIHAAAPEAEEAMRYGIPTFRLHNKNHVHFGGYTEHIGLGLVKLKRYNKPQWHHPST